MILMVIELQPRSVLWVHSFYRFIRHTVSRLKRSIAAVSKPQSKGTKRLRSKVK